MLNNTFPSPIYETMSLQSLCSLKINFPEFNLPRNIHEMALWYSLSRPLEVLGVPLSHVYSYKGWGYYHESL